MAIKEEECKLRYFYGESYIAVNKTKEYELDPCSGGGTHKVEYEVTKYHPDIFGLMHLQGFGMRKVTVNKMRMTVPPTLREDRGEVGLYYRVRQGLIFAFDKSPDVNYKMIKLKSIRPRDVRILFRRVDGTPITSEELELVKTSKYIFIRNGL